MPVVWWVNYCDRQHVYSDTDDDAKRHSLGYLFKTHCASLLTLVLLVLVPIIVVSVSSSLVVIITVPIVWCVLDLYGMYALPRTFKKTFEYVNLVTMMVHILYAFVDVFLGVVTIVTALSLIRCRQVLWMDKWMKKAECPRSQWRRYLAFQVFLTVCDLILMPMYVLLYVSWRRSLTMNEWYEKSNTLSGECERRVVVLVQMLKVVCDVPFVVLFGALWVVNPPRALSSVEDLRFLFGVVNEKRLSLRARTLVLTQLGLCVLDYLTLLPLTLVFLTRYRWKPAHEKWSECGDAFYARDPVVLHEENLPANKHNRAWAHYIVWCAFLNLFIDIFFWPFALVAVCIPWRSAYFRAEFGDEAKSNGGKRLLCVKTVLLFVVDVLTLPMWALVLVTMYRVPKVWKVIKELEKPKDWNKVNGFLFRQSIEVLIDLPIVALMIVTCLYLPRTAMLIRGVRATGDAVARRYVVLHQSSLALLDILCVGLLPLLLHRARGCWRAVKSCETPYHLYTQDCVVTRFGDMTKLHRIVFSNVANTIIDLPFILFGVILCLLPHRSRSFYNEFLSSNTTKERRLLTITNTFWFIVYDLPCLVLLLPFAAMFWRWSAVYVEWFVCKDRSKIASLFKHLMLGVCDIVMFVLWCVCMISGLRSRAMWRTTLSEASGFHPISALVVIMSKDDDITGEPLSLYDDSHNFSFYGAVFKDFAMLLVMLVCLPLIPIFLLTAWRIPALRKAWNESYEKGEMLLYKTIVVTFGRSLVDCVLAPLVIPIVVCAVWRAPHIKRTVQLQWKSARMHTFSAYTLILRECVYSVIQLPLVPVFLIMMCSWRAPIVYRVWMSNVQHRWKLLLWQFFFVCCDPLVLALSFGLLWRWRTVIDTLRVLHFLDKSEEESVAVSPEATNAKPNAPSALEMNIGVNGSNNYDHHHHQQQENSSQFAPKDMKRMTVVAKSTDTATLGEDVDATHYRALPGGTPSDSRSRASTVSDTCTAPTNTNNNEQQYIDEDSGKYYRPLPGGTTTTMSTECVPPDIDERLDTSFKPSAPIVEPYANTSSVPNVPALDDRQEMMERDLDGRIGVMGAVEGAEAGTNLDPRAPPMEAGDVAANNKFEMEVQPEKIMYTPKSEIGLLSALWYALASPMSDTRTPGQIHLLIVAEVVQMVCDLPFVLMGVVCVITRWALLYRVAKLRVKNFMLPAVGCSPKHVYHEFRLYCQEKNWLYRWIIARQFYLFIVDIMVLVPCVVLLILFPWRLGVLRVWYRAWRLRRVHDKSAGSFKDGLHKAQYGPQPAHGGLDESLEATQPYNKAQLKHMKSAEREDLEKQERDLEATEALPVNAEYLAYRRVQIEGSNVDKYLLVFNRSRWLQNFKADEESILVFLEVYQLLEDLPYVILGVILLAFVWRIPSLVNAIRLLDTEMSAKQRRAGVKKVAWSVIEDLPAVTMAAIMLVGPLSLGVWVLIPRFRHGAHFVILFVAFAVPYRSVLHFVEMIKVNTAVDRRRLTWYHAALWIVDVPAFLCFLTVVITRYRHTVATYDISLKRMSSWSARVAVAAGSKYPHAYKCANRWFVFSYDDGKYHLRKELCANSPLTDTVVDVDEDSTSTFRNKFVWHQVMMIQSFHVFVDFVYVVCGVVVMATLWRCGQLWRDLVPRHELGVNRASFREKFVSQSNRHVELEDDLDEHSNLSSEEDDVVDTSLASLATANKRDDVEVNAQQFKWVSDPVQLPADSRFASKLSMCVQRLELIETCRDAALSNFIEFVAKDLWFVVLLSVACVIGPHRVPALIRRFQECVNVSDRRPHIWNMFKQSVYDVPAFIGYLLILVSWRCIHVHHQLAKTTNASEKRSCVWREFKELLWDIPFVVMAVACLYRLPLLVRDCYHNGTASARRRAASQHMICVFLDILSLPALLVVGMWMYRVPRWWQEATTKCKSGPFRVYSIDRKYGERFAPYWCLYRQALSQCVDIPCNICGILCVFVPWRAYFIHKEMRVCDEVRQFSRGDHRWICLKNFFQAIVDVVFIVIALPLIFPFVWRGAFLLYAIYRRHNMSKELPDLDIGVTSGGVRWLIVQQLCKAPLDIICVAFFLSGAWRLPTVYSAIKRGKGLHRSVMQGLIGLFKDIGAMLMCVGIVLGIQRIVALVKKAHTLRKRYARLCQLQKESGQKHVVDLIEERAVEDDGKSVDIFDRSLDVEWTVALASIRKHDGFGVYDVLEGQDELDRLSCENGTWQAVGVDAEDSGKRRLSEQQRIVEALKYDPDPLHSKNRVRELSFKDYPFSLSLLYGLMWHELKLSFTLFPDVVKFPFRVLSLLFIPTYSYIEWRRNGLDELIPEEELEENAMCIRRRRAEVSDAVTRVESLTMSYLSYPVVWLYYRAPVPKFRLQRNRRMELFLVVNVLAVVPLILNEMAMIVGVVHFVCSIIATGGVRERRKGTLGVLSLFWQGLLVPLMIVLEVALFFLPLTLQVFFDSQVHRNKWDWDMRQWYVWVFQPLWALVWIGGMNFGYKWVRMHNRMFRPFAMYRQLLLCLAGRGMYGRFIALQTDAYSALKRHGVIGTLIAEIYMIVVFCLWAFWPIILILALDTHLLLLIPCGTLSLLWAFNGKRIVKDRLKNADKQQQQQRGDVVVVVTPEIEEEPPIKNDDHVIRITPITNHNVVVAAAE